MLDGLKAAKSKCFGNISQLNKYRIVNPKVLIIYLFIKLWFEKNALLHLCNMASTMCVFPDFPRLDI